MPSKSIIDPQPQRGTLPKQKTVYNIWRNLSDTLKKKISRLRSKFGADESLDIALSDWRYHQHMRFMVEILDMGVPHLQQQPQASFSGIVITESSNS
ncbi:hypothetical protein L596_028451 [Steinernema carpocapsae]|uniref:Uncharacterized protein n=1 Tax=Steinernema carpocapsae TaxID=34508 RepID=A0A4U5LYH8_STECR|nr:hypothetical protein L596_028451 [Steinernema carpocapsae]